MKYDYVFVDANALGYAGNSNDKLMAGDQHTGAINHIVGEVRDLYYNYPDSQIIFLWDKKSEWRYDLLPEYKGKRADTEEKRAIKARYHAQVPAIKKLLYGLGVTQISANGYEADDLAAYYSRRCTMAKKHCILITGDKDWLQLISPYVKWKEHRLHNIVDVDNFQEVTGCGTVIQFLMEKCLQGDTSDNIKGVGGIGKKAARSIYDEFGSLSNLFKWHDGNGDFTKDNIPDSLRRYKKRLNDLCAESSEGRQLLKRNLKLMSLLKVERPSEVTIVQSRNLLLVRELLAEFAFHQVLNSFDSYTDIVKGNKSWVEI